MTKIMQNGHNVTKVILGQVTHKACHVKKYPQVIPDFISIHNILTSSILKLAVSHSSFRQTYMH